MLTIEGKVHIELDIYHALVERGIILGTQGYRLSEFISNTLAQRVDREAPDLEIDSGSIYFEAEDV